MTRSIEDSYAPEGHASHDAFELTDQIVGMFRTILATNNLPIVYLIVGPDWFHVGRISQIVETFTDGREVRSIHLDLVDQETRP